jgi:hypothetical protein
MGERWALMRGPTRLGVLRVVDVDQPWFECAFEPTAVFEQVRELFEEEQRLLDADELDAWARAWERISVQRLVLEPLDGGARVEEFMLHVDGQTARLRL